mgnify:CR=1 FL=1
MIKAAGKYDFRNIRRIQPLEFPNGRRKKIRYINAVTAFDIETTFLKKYRQSVLYHWQFQINRTTVTGRTWTEFRDFYNGLNKAIHDDCYMIVYVHNLSYEFQFLKSIIPVDEVFAMDKRKILYFRSGKLEFRCSYLLTNMSLDRFLKSMNVPDQKIKGFDYSRQRFPWTRLSDDEIHYCINDVKGLTAALIKKMTLDNDNLYTIPLTSTGYSRRLAKKALAKQISYIRSILPDEEVFRMLRDEFRGGDTHANRHNANKIIRAEDIDDVIDSWDISSSYPAVMLTEKYPQKFIPADPRYLIQYINYGKACLFYISFENIRLKDDSFGDPYLSKAKCSNIIDAVYDNGRILSAGALRTCLNEIDFSIVAAEYDFDGYIVDNLYIAKKQLLPEPLRKLIKQTYADKTALKGTGRDYEYNHKKGLFNAYYGMMVQNPCKPEYKYDPVSNILIEDFEKPESDLIAEYHKKGWLPYQWGVWVTSYARLKLHKGIHCVKPDDFLYCDTDSVKGMGDYSEAFNELNKEYLNEELSARDSKGNIHYIGIYEHDDRYKAFKTMGAKKYAYIDMNDQLHITISGVNKRKGAAELGSIENFQEGFIFRSAGGTESIYNDDPEVKEVKIQGHKLEITSNLAIVESTYTLSLTLEYRRLLNFLNETDIRYSLHYER